MTVTEKLLQKLNATRKNVIPHQRYKSNICNEHNIMKITVSIKRIFLLESILLFQATQFIFLCKEDERII